MAQLVANPHPGDVVDETVIRTKIGDKIYFGSNRAQGVLSSNGYEYVYQNGVVTTISTDKGKGEWFAVYDSSAGKIYGAGEAWDNASGLRASVFVIDTATDTLTRTLLNAAGKATGDVNELVAILDDGANLVVGERCTGGLTSGSDFPNGGGLWTIPKATIGDASTFTRVYEDPGKRLWANIVKRGSTYYNLLTTRTNGAYLIQTSTNLTIWTNAVDGTANALNDICPSMIYHAGLDLVLAVVSDAARNVTLQRYNGTAWAAFDLGIDAVSTGSVYLTLVRYDATRLLLIVGNGFGLPNTKTHDIWIVSDLTTTPKVKQAALVQTGSMGGQIIVDGTDAYYGTIYPGYLTKANLAVCG